MTENEVSPLTSILNHQLLLLGFPNNEHYRYIAMLALIMTLTDSSNKQFSMFKQRRFIYSPCYADEHNKR